MKKIIWSLLMLFATSVIMKAQNSVHDFIVKDISGNDFYMSQMKGNKVLIVNTASKCGLTPQYEDLEKLYKKYKSEGFVIIGFPANNFLGQEPGSNEEIASFCQVNYGVSFPMMSKISVKGSDQHALYAWLTQKNLNNKMDSKVKWNFQKYMIDENGQLVDVVYPKEKPFSDKIVNWIEGN